MCIRDRYTDASISEACVHMIVQVSAIVGVLLGNVMYLDLDPQSPNRCQNKANNEAFGVEARDYSPFYYFIMAMSTILPIGRVQFI